MRSVPRVVLTLLMLLVTGFAPVASATAPQAAAASAAPVNALVTLAPDADADAVTRGLHATGFTLVERFDFAGVWAVTGPAAAVAALPAVVPGVTHAVVDEPLTPLMSRARDVVNANGPGGAPLAETGRNVTIAVVDSGVDASHPGFDGRVRAAVQVKKNGAVRDGYGDADGHGTHVAGVALGDGAMSANARHHGIAPDAGLAILDISDAFTTTSAIRAFRWIHDHYAEHDIRVVTNSWGREKDENHYNPDDPVIRASNALVADGLVVVFSAGNRGHDGRASLTVEAVNPNVLAVGATDFQGRVEPYSSRGPALDADGESLPWVKPDFAAPGTGIWSARANAPSDGTRESDWYVPMNGTSMAAPQVAAAAALLVSRHPHLAPGQVAQVLAETARDVGPAGPDTATGYGLIDVTAALDAVSGAPEARTVTVTRLVPIEAAGSVTGAEGVVLASGTHVHAPPVDTVRVPVTFPAATTRVTAWFNWSAVTTDWHVTLVSPNGTRTAPFAERADGSILVDALAAPGVWTLEARPRGVAVATEWSLEGHALVKETRALEATSDPRVPEGFGLFGPAGFVEAPTTGIMSLMLREMTLTRGLGTLSLTAALALLVIGRKRRFA